MRKINLRFLSLCAIGSIFSGLFGFMIAGANNVTFDGHEHTPNHLSQTSFRAGEINHSHESRTPLQLANESEVPTLQAQLKIDSVSGFNLHLNTSNFQFAPELSGLEHVNGKGHAHLYIDEQKIARLYSPWFHISKIPKGAKQIKVTLNSNDHRPFVFKNSIISSVIKLDSK